MEWRGCCAFFWQPEDDLVEMLEDAENVNLCTEEGGEKRLVIIQRSVIQTLKKLPLRGGHRVSRAVCSGGLPEQTIEALAKRNKDYEEKFGYIFIVCATGKSAERDVGIAAGKINDRRRGDRNGGR